MVHLWQRNYYEPILRHQTNLDECCNDILTNPDLWNDDPENPHASQRNLP